MPAIRMLAKNLSYPPAIPHVYTGIESILPLMARMAAAAADTPSKRSRRAGNESKAPMAAVSELKTVALVIVIFLYVAINEGWMRMEWFLNIAPLESIDEMEGVEMAANGTVRSTAGPSSGLRGGSSDYIGLGTMLQDATDYLGERQRQDYKAWKAKIMARLEVIEAGA
jgi:origin recognition complex subunit 6